MINVSNIIKYNIEKNEAYLDGFTNIFMSFDKIEDTIHKFANTKNIKLLDINDFTKAGDLCVCFSNLTENDTLLIINRIFTNEQIKNIFVEVLKYRKITIDLYNENKINSVVIKLENFKVIILSKPAVMVLDEIISECNSKFILGKHELVQYSYSDFDASEDEDNDEEYEYDEDLQNILIKSEFLKKFGNDFVGDDKNGYTHVGFMFPFEMLKDVTNNHIENISELKAIIDNPENSGDLFLEVNNSVMDYIFGFNKNNFQGSYEEERGSGDYCWSLDFGRFEIDSINKYIKYTDVKFYNSNLGFTYEVQRFSLIG